MTNLIFIWKIASNWNYSHARRRDYDAYYEWYGPLCIHGAAASGTFNKVRNGSVPLMYLKYRGKCGPNELGAQLTRVVRCDIESCHSTKGRNFSSVCEWLDPQMGKLICNSEIVHLFDVNFYINRIYGIFCIWLDN